MTLEGRMSSFRLLIADYEFPEITDDELDSNWLVVEGLVSIGGKQWQFCFPCLTTFEAIRLSEWLDATSNGVAQKAYCAFTEPNLEFHKLSTDTIQVSFALESAPPWAKRGDEEAAYWVEVPIGPALATAAGQLRHQLERFPARGRCTVATASLHCNRVILRRSIDSGNKTHHLHPAD